MVNSALGMAIEVRRPKAGTLLHSEHSPRYTSWTFSQRVRSAGLAQSLGSIGDAFDNAVVESFWARMQTELLDNGRWRTRVELFTEIFDWIEIFYGPEGTAVRGCSHPSSMRSFTLTTRMPPDSRTMGPR
jgi:transposase InsO family protein